MVNIYQKVYLLKPLSKAKRGAGYSFIEVINLPAKRKKNAPKTSKLAKKIIATLILVVILAVIVYLALDYERLFTQKIAAVVNGEKITLKELEKSYNGLPDQYKLILTKQDLLDQLINERLLLQEAAKQNITAAKWEVNSSINDFMLESGLESEKFSSELAAQGLSIKDLQVFYEKSLMISKLLNKTINPKIEITEQEIKDFYAQNKEMIMAQNPEAGPENAQRQIRDYLFSEKQAKLLEGYLNDLKSKSEIKIEIEKFKTFKSTGDEVCVDGKRPVVRLYTTTNCKSCDWVQNAFDLLAINYVNEGNIAAYHWVLDTGDDRLTNQVETAVPKPEIEIFKKYNPKSTVPTFIFGCKYARIGNGYEDDNNLEAEKEEFKAIISELTS